jgi:hypothetical protein
LTSATPEGPKAEESTNFFNPGARNPEMNATNLDNGFAVEDQKKPGTSGSMGVKSNVKPEALAK